MKTIAKTRMSFNLLGSNTKLDKVDEGGQGDFLLAGLSLAPAKSSGFNVCPKATPG